MKPTIEEFVRELKTALAHNLFVELNLEHEEECVSIRVRAPIEAVSKLHTHFKTTYGHLFDRVICIDSYGAHNFHLFAIDFKAISDEMSKPWTE